MITAKEARRLVGLGVASMVACSASAAAAAPTAVRPECRQFVARLEEPITAEARLIKTDWPNLDPAVLQPTEDGKRTIPAYLPLLGFEARVLDPRFAAVRVDKHAGTIHPCGYVVHISWSPRLSEATGQRQQVRFRFSKRTPILIPASREALELGARPRLPGYVAGSSWPLSAGKSRSFIGLMHPKDGKAETIVVRFKGPESREPTVVVARFPMSFQYVNLFPCLHRNCVAVNLEGKDGDGSYRFAQLDYWGEGTLGLPNR